MEYIIENIEEVEFKQPKILYKYRDWDNDNHKKIIFENTVYLASPSGFEDIYDCNVPEIFPSKGELFSMFLNKSKKDFPYNTIQQHAEYAVYWSLNSPMANPSELEKLVKEFNKTFNDCFGVLSVTEDPKNELMWEKYGASNTGLCVGFDPVKLFEIVGGGGEVQYADELPIIDFIDDNFETRHIKNILYKEKKWEFEKEYRLHKMWNRNISNIERNLKLLYDCIVEVILGAEMTDKNKNEIYELVKSKYPHVRIINNS